MTPTEEIFLRRFQARSAVSTPELVAEIMAVYEAIRRLLSEEELAKAVADQTIYALVDEIVTGSPQAPAAARLRALLGRTGLEAARQAARDLPAGLTAGFNTLNPAVITAATELQTRVVRELSAEVRETLIQTVTDGLAAGRGPRAVAVRMVENVGLPPHYARAVERFRQQLEAGDRAALSRALLRGVLEESTGAARRNAYHAGGRGLTRGQYDLLARQLGRQPLTPHQIDTLTTSYRRRLAAWHAETLARTAALDAQRAGQRASWEDAIDRGVVQRERLRKRWLTTLDGRERPEHRAMNGKTAGFDEPFPNGQVVPGENEYNCRCVAMYYLAARRPLAVAA